MVYARVCTVGDDSSDDEHARENALSGKGQAAPSTLDSVAQAPDLPRTPELQVQEVQQDRGAQATPALLFGPVFDFTERDGAVADQRELLLYAVPLTRDEQSPVSGLVFLPVSAFREAEDPTKDQGLMGGIKKKLGDQWEEMKAAEPGTFSHKVYKVGLRLANNQTPEERLVRNIPKKVSKVIIHHPASIQPDVVAERLHSMTEQGTWSTAKATVAAIMLPVAFGIDVLIIPGPSVLTWYTGYQVYKHTSNAAGAKALRRLLVQQQGSPAPPGAVQEGQVEPERVRVNYAPDPRLDEYLELTQASPDGLLPEEACERLVEELGQHELLEPLLELRKRARAPGVEVGTRVDERGQEYQPLTSRDH